MSTSPRSIRPVWRAAISSAAVLAALVVPGYLISSVRAVPPGEPTTKCRYALSVQSLPPEYPYCGTYPSIVCGPEGQCPGQCEGDVVDVGGCRFILIYTQRCCDSTEE